MSSQPILGFFEGHRDLRATDLYEAARQPFGAATLLPRLAYRSKAFADLEDEAVWTRGWICVGHHDRIPAPGDLLPHTVGSHGVHVLRRADGSLAAHFNFAQHGGCRFVPHQCQTGRKTSCFYTSCGQSRDRDVVTAGPGGAEVPEMYMYLGNNPSKLITVRVDSIGSLVFVNLDAGDDRPDPLFAVCSAVLRRFADGALPRIGRFQAEGAFNWKLLGKAATDGASTVSTTHFSDHRTTGCVQHAGAGDDTRPRTVVWLFPNLLIRVFADCVVTSILQATGLTETLEICDVFAIDDDTSCARWDNAVAHAEVRIRIDQTSAAALQRAVAGAANPSPFIPQQVDDSPPPREDNALAWSFNRLLTNRLLAQHTYVDLPLYGRPGRSLNAGVNA
jgi:hypothetical protein